MTTEVESRSDAPGNISGLERSARDVWVEAGCPGWATERMLEEMSVEAFERTLAFPGRVLAVYRVRAREQGFVPLYG